MSNFTPLTARAMGVSNNNKTESLEEKKLSAMMQALKKNHDSKKAKMLNAFSQINIQHLIELERIKKPSQI